MDIETILEYLDLSRNTLSVHPYYHLCRPIFQHGAQRGPRTCLVLLLIKQGIPTKYKNILQNIILLSGDNNFKDGLLWQFKIQSFVHEGFFRVKVARP